MKQETLKNLNSLKNNELDLIPYPPFLGYSFKGFSLVTRKKQNKVSESFLKNLQKKYSSYNTLIVYNGEIIFNNVDGLIINNIKNEVILNNKFDYLNKSNCNSELNLKFTKSLEDEITIVVSGTNDIYHYANYEILPNTHIKINEQFEILTSAKLNYRADIIVKENASLQLLYIEFLKNRYNNIISHNANIYENAQFNLNYINVNSANVIHTTNADMLGKYAISEVNTLNIVSEKNNVANLICLEHRATNTTSNIYNFGVVNHTAQLTIDGKNIIEKGFSKSEAEQETKILNLTDTAKSIANPQLIINEYDVKAGHAAGVGQIDEESLYYLMSRGLTKKQSLELIILSYANPLLEKIKNKKQALKVLKIIQNKLV